MRRPTRVRVSVRNLPASLSQLAFLEELEPLVAMLAPRPVLGSFVPRKTSKRRGPRQPCSRASRTRARRARCVMRSTGGALLRAWLWSWRSGSRGGGRVATATAGDSAAGAAGVKAVARSGRGDGRGQCSRRSGSGGRGGAASGCVRCAVSGSRRMRRSTEQSLVLLGGRSCDKYRKDFFVEKSSTMRILTGFYLWSSYFSEIARSRASDFFFASCGAAPRRNNTPQGAPPPLRGGLRPPSAGGSAPPPRGAPPPLRAGHNYIHQLD